MTNREMGIEEARKSLGDLVLDAQRDGIATRITRKGKPAAILMADATTSHGPDRYRADPIAMSGIVAAAEAAPEDSPEGKRVRWARYCFERWALHTIVSTCRDWGTLSVTEKAIWIDMVAMMEGKI